MVPRRVCRQEHTLPNRRTETGFARCALSHCEEYDTLGEPIPEEVWNTKPDNVVVDLPLLRLVHGLPGAGKSKVILWIKSYLEDVWLWEHNNQFAIVAPFNSMADNISGGTLHSFAGIPFKDRRGIVVNSGQHMSDDGQSLLGQKWHNLRLLICDEIEACGVDLVGQMEDKMRRLVPVANSVALGRQSTQHTQRNTEFPFGGVNVLFFGDFWQLDPVGGKSFMSNQPIRKQR